MRSPFTQLIFFFNLKNKFEKTNEKKIKNPNEILLNCTSSSNRMHIEFFVMFKMVQNDKIIECACWTVCYWFNLGMLEQHRN